MRPEDRRHQEGERQRSDEQTAISTNEDREKREHDRSDEIDDCLSRGVSEAERSFKRVERITVCALERGEPAEQPRILAQAGETDDTPRKSERSDGYDDRQRRCAEATRTNEPQPERPEEDLRRDGRAKQHRYGGDALAVAPGGSHDEQQKQADRSVSARGIDGHRPERGSVATPIRDSEQSKCEGEGGEAQYEEEKLRDGVRKEGEWHEHDGGDRRIDERRKRPCGLVRKRLQRRVWRTAVEDCPSCVPKCPEVGSVHAGRRDDGHQEGDEQRREHTERDDGDATRDRAQPSAHDRTATAA
ncbi:MAG TPA: hypothetical protein VFM96_08270 [Gaiellaceae bacterium]|nr:hypothetical protein [Gaiellaceae bacterium]